MSKILVNFGEEFYDKIDPIRYERCVLGPNGERGGTGEIFERVSHDRFEEVHAGMKEEDFDAVMDTYEMITDVEIGPFVMIRKVP